MAKTSHRELGDHELVQRLADEKQSLFNLRFRLATGSLERSSQIKQTKKEIARLMTELRAREIVAAEAAERGDS